MNEEYQDFARKDFSKGIRQMKDIDNEEEINERQVYLP